MEIVKTFSVMTDKGFMTSDDIKNSFDSFKEIVRFFGDDIKDLNLKITAQQFTNERISIEVL